MNVPVFRLVFCVHASFLPSQQWWLVGCVQTTNCIKVCQLFCQVHPSLSGGKNTPFVCVQAWASWDSILCLMIVWKLLSRLRVINTSNCRGSQCIGFTSEQVVWKISQDTHRSTLTCGYYKVKCPGYSCWLRLKTEGDVKKNVPYRVWSVCGLLSKRFQTRWIRTANLTLLLQKVHSIPVKRTQQ